MQTCRRSTRPCVSKFDRPLQHATLAMAVFGSKARDRRHRRHVRLPPIAPEFVPCMVDGVGSVGRESKRAIRWTPTYLFAGSHPNLARFGMDVALNRAGLAS